mmetsp:Transcript_3491/g.4301  ORF Transcript_3491/g.4301 Transcript_3491/m.4301 type:complete len:92 (+) Transcript_3491:1176-1451(+)
MQKKFNGEASWIVADAQVLDNELQRLLEKNNLLHDEVQTEEESTVSAKAAPKKRKLKLKLSLKRKQSDGNSTEEPPKKRRGRKKGSTPSKT